MLTFHLQTRLNPDDRNETEALPKGTLIRVRLLDSVDSDADHDGSEFHGTVVSSVVSGNEVIVHPIRKSGAYLHYSGAETTPKDFVTNLSSPGLVIMESLTT